MQMYSLFPPEANGKGVRYVDKLVKVFLKSGGDIQEPSATMPNGPVAA